MGNEQSVDGEPVPETGLRLSTLCRYQAEPDNEEGLTTFSWFQSSTDVSGLALRGAHRWGYILSHVGGQRLFKDTRQRFFVLLDHYMCFFDSHAPEARMKGSIDLDKGHCHLELLPRPPETVDSLLQGGGGGGGGGGGESDDHRVEVTRRSDEFSMVLCFSSPDSLSDWMKSIFDVQQRKATFSRLGHGRGTGAGDGDDNDDRVDGRGHVVGDEPSLRGSLLGRRLYSSGGTGTGSTTNARGRSRGRGGRRRARRRGTLDSSPPPPRPPRRPHREGRGVPSSWADAAADGDAGSAIVREGDGGGGMTEGGRGERSPPEDPLRPPLPPTPTPRPSSSSSVWLGKASERLAGLPRGGRAAGGDGGIHGGGSGGGSNLDEYGAFTTAQASIYEGWTRGLQPHGWGRMIFANGDCVEGWWEHDVLQGSGATYKSRREGWTFTGGYAAGRRDGPGRLVTAQGDAWECEWRRGVVAPASRGTHVAAAGGEVYQGVCGPSPDDPAVPCRAGQGRLRRRNGEQVDTRFRAGKAVDGAKGVVKFRNGAIFFGELREARPHGYGELYLSSVKAAGNRRTRKPSGTLAELAETARDVLWYKGNFRSGKPHGSGLIKFKDPLPTVTPAVARAGRGRGGSKREGGVSMASPAQGVWGESKGDDGEEEREVKVEAGGKGGAGVVNGGGVDGRGTEGGGGGGDGEEEEEDAVRHAGVAARATDECMMEEEEEEGEEDETSTDSDEEDEDEEEMEMEEEGGEQEERGERRFNRSRSRGGASLRDGAGDHATPRATTRRGSQRPSIDGGSSGGGGGGGGGGADMEYEAEFVDGVMVRHDASHLRLAALRFGRAEIRRLNTLLRKEEDAMSRLRVRGLCLLCNVEEMNALLVGCRHHVLCCGCAARADSCPLCGERIGKVVKTYST